MLVREHQLEEEIWGVDIIYMRGEGKSINGLDGLVKVVAI